MSLTIETELKDIFTKIDNRLERIEQGQNELKLSVEQGQNELKLSIEQGQNELKLSVVELKGEVKNLETKIDGLSTRVGSQEFLSRTIVGGLVLIILGGAAKMFWNFTPT